MTDYKQQPREGDWGKYGSPERSQLKELLEQWRRNPSNGNRHVQAIIDFIREEFLPPEGEEKLCNCDPKNFKPHRPGYTCPKDSPVEVECEHTIDETHNWGGIKTFQRTCGKCGKWFTPRNLIPTKYTELKPDSPAPIEPLKPVITLLEQTLLKDMESKVADELVRVAIKLLKAAQQQEVERLKGGE